ncbi:Mu transposase C-terminal domain-containing protein [Pleionea mediterranea]|uniref:Putative transposase n=1 Tax=Pleionea mediterranea TaxID=523701 RepID=A0A316FVP2_9GAMM|nr:Mu transposase C-terminal domain-containing protein [Pleionea mediterranea]PWK52854.1 putative transposase [Pleionea mediterranea]
MTSLKLKVNELVSYKGRNFRIRLVYDYERLLLVHDKTGESEKVSVHDVGPPTGKNKQPFNHLVRPTEDLSEHELKIANQRFLVIEPLIYGEKLRTTEQVINAAHKHNVSVATLYRWIAQYESTLQIASLAPSKRSDQGKGRIQEEKEKLIEEVIEVHYLKDQRKSIKATYRELEQLCRANGLTPPGYQTLRRRINGIPKDVQTERRYDKMERDHIFSPILKGYEEATFPLSVVQIDHTPVDIILVSEKERESVGRAWLTVAICVYSRMVCGYYLAYEQPSIFSVGQCLFNSLVPKVQFLAKREVKGDWPIWGKMKILHSDNAKEFRSTNLQKVLHNYNINAHFRAKSNPNWGAHIERLLGTFNKRIQELPGTTFSDTKSRGRYKAENKAVFSLDELDRWLCEFIVNEYHVNKHSKLGMSPLEKLSRGITGTDDAFGSGLPEKILDENRLYIDLLPTYKRAVNKYGITIDYLDYNSPHLAKWISIKNPKSEDGTGKYIVKVDPQDVRRIFFLDPDLSDYLEVQCNLNVGGPLSAWELKTITNKLKAESDQKIDANRIFEARERMREIEEEAKAKTMKQRRFKERKKQAKKSITNTPNSNKEGVDLSIFDEDIQAFDDIGD